MAQPVWTLPEVRAWMEWAEENQKEIQQKLLGKREYDFFESTDLGKKLLREKIAFAMCGPPRHEDLSRGQEEETKITKVFDMICKQNEGQKSFRVSFLFLACLTREERSYMPVIRLHFQGKATKDIFIDNVPRSYHGFQDYLENNRLPKCLMCFPESGSYFLSDNQTLSIGFQTSPACGNLQKVLRMTDVASLAATVAVAAVGAASMVVPVLAVPAMVYGVCVTSGASAVYAAGRSVSRLYDIGTHGTSLGLGNPEARNSWLTVGGAVVCATPLLAPISVWTQAPFLASVTVTGLGVANGVTHIAQKRMKGEAIDAKDKVYLAAAILFFGNAVVTTYQASVLVDDMLAKGLTTDNVLKYVESFFTQKMSAAAQKRLDLGRLLDSNAVVNLVSIGSLNIVPDDTQVDYSECFRSSCKYIAEHAKKYADKLLDVADSAQVLYSVLDRLRGRYRSELIYLIDWFCKVKQQTSLSKLFGDVTVRDALDIGAKFVHFATWLSNHVQEVVEQNCGSDQRVSEGLTDVVALQEQAGSVRPEDGLQEWTEEFQRSCDLLKKEFQRQTASYQEKFETAKRYSPTLTESAFQEVEGISGPLKEYLWKKALTQLQDDFNGEASLLRLTKGLTLANPGSSGLEDPETGMKVYFFHGETPAGNDQQLSSEQIVALASERVGSDLVQSATLEVDVESRLAFFRDLPGNAEGVTCIIVQCVPEDGSVAGHVYVVKDDGD